jgi:hypothetical protein
MVLDLIDVYPLTKKKKKSKNFTCNSNFEIYMQFFKLYDVHYFVKQLYSIRSNSSMFVRFLRIID